MVLIRCVEEPIHGPHEGELAPGDNRAPGEGERLTKASVLGAPRPFAAAPGAVDAARFGGSARGADFMCHVRPGLGLSAFPVGTQVKLRCHRLDGKFRLGFIKSEQAVVEVPHKPPPA
jgi:hypothetical protein